MAQNWTPLYHTNVQHYPAVSSYRWNPGNPHQSVTTGSVASRYYNRRAQVIAGTHIPGIPQTNAYVPSYVSMR